MSVKIADKIVQYNNGSYFLMDSSAVEYIDKNGNSQSLKDVLDNTSTDNSTHKTVTFGDDIDMGRYLLLAKITDAKYTTNNIIKFSCPNFKGQGDGFNYEDDMDILKFELHFNTGSYNTNNDYGVTLKQHGLVLYSYPLNNPQNTAPEIKEAVRVYWDYNNGVVYVFLVDMEVAIPHCVLEYTGSGTLLEENTFVGDTYYNWQDGLNGTWQSSKWKSISYDKLETPPIYELGGDGGSTEGTKTYTSLSELGLTAPVSVGDIFNAMPNNTMAVLACEAKDETEGTVNISDIPMSFGVLTIKKNEKGRFSIDYQNSLQSSPCNVKRWIGTLKGLDGTGLYWKLISTQTTYTALSDMGLTAGATVQDVIDALPIGCTAHLRTDGFTNWSTLFNNIQWGYFKVEKTVGGLSNIELQEVVLPNRRYFGAQSGGKFSKWQQVASEITDVLTNSSTIAQVPNAKLVAGEIHGKYFDIADYSDALAMPVGRWRVDSNNKASQMQNLPVSKAGILEVKYLLGNDGSTAYTGSYKYAMLTYTVIDGNKYERSFNSDGTAGNIVNDTGWQQIITENSKTDPYSCTGYTVLTGTEDLFTLAPGHYASAKVDTTYNYPITDSSNVTAHIYVLGCLNEPANNKGYRIILYFDNKGRMYRINEWWGSFGNGWQQISDIKTLVTNTTTLKLDVTKRNTGWYGAIKLTYLYDTSPAEIEISFRSATDDLRWAVINGQKYIKKITFTQDSSNTAHYTIGVEFSGATYGCYQAEVIGDFAVINSLTGEAFTGAKTAVYNSPWGKNNGVTLVSAPEDIGLTFPCTSVQLVQAMRDKFNKTINAGAIGVFNCGGKTVTITDAPSDYGLLHIETFGHDRILIRFDGIGSSSYAGSWIGQIKGSNGTFSSITWEKIISRTEFSELRADVSSLENHNTSGEKQIGYLNGAELYERIYKLPGGGGSIDGTLGTLENVNVISITGVINIGSSFFPIPHKPDDSTSFEVYIQNGKIVMKGMVGTGYSTGYVTITYTKK